MPKAYLPLFFWIVLAFVLCLMPGPDVLDERLSEEQRSEIRGHDSMGLCRPWGRGIKTFSGEK